MKTKKMTQDEMKIRTKDFAMRILKPHLLESLIQEADEIVSIVVVSIKTARKSKTNP